MRTPALLAAALCAALAASCSVEVDPLRPGALVTCSGEADCPSGFFCSQVLGRCVERGGADQAAPELVGSPAVTPARVRAGATVTVTFEVDEDLSSEPFVHLDGSAEPLGLPSRAGHAYTVEFAATSALGAGQRTVLVDLVDLYGNEATNQLVGQFLVDLTLPGVVTSSFPPFARQGDTVVASVTFDEAIGGTPALTAGGKVFTPAAGGAGGTQWTFTRQLDGSEPEVSDVEFSLAAADLAGNLLEATLRPGTAFDFTPPTVAGATIATPSVRPGDTFLGSVQLSEALGDPPDVWLVPAGGGTLLEVAASAIDAATWSLSYEVPAGAADASYTLTLEAAADRAGNPAAGQALGEVTFDSAPPSITAAAVEHANRLYRAGQTVQVSFTLGEAVPAPPSVKLDVGAATLAFTCPAPAGLTYTCTSTGPILASFPEGGANVSITATDAAGNVGTAAAPLVLDFTPPGLASTPATRYLGSASTRSVTVSAVGTGSSFEVALLTNEPLSGAPVVTAAAPGGAPSRTLQLTASNAPANTSFTFTLPADATAHPAATWTVRWTGSDAAGNAHPAPVAIATVEVDGVAPAAPATGTAAAPALLWTRTPWGTHASATPVFRLDASLASVGADATTLVAWDGPAAAAREVGRATGTAPFVLPLGADPAELYVSTLDRAGNESARTRVVDVAWTAALGGKVAGSTFENPHRLETRGHSMGTLVQIDSAEVSAGALGLAGDGLLVTTEGASTYRPAAAPAHPAPRGRYQLAADLGRGVTVLHGGTLASGADPGDTWEWNGAEWREVYPSDPEGDGNPSPYADMVAYDPVRGGVLLGGGGLWLWNGASWRRLTTLPGTGYGGALTWDAARGLLVYFDRVGGNRTWEWDGTTWRDVTPAAPGETPPVNPSAGTGSFASYYDAAAQQVRVFVGLPTSGSAQVWGWNGTRWAQVATTGTTPPNRYEFALAYDPDRRLLLVHSGWLAAGGSDGATWVLSEAGVWSDQSPATGPLYLQTHRATFDPLTRTLLVFGDTGLYAPVGLRQWDAATHLFALLSPGDPEGDGNPTWADVYPRYGDLTFVPARGRAVYARAFGARETWEWDRTSWVLRTTTAGPANRGSMSAGSSGSDAIFFGGIDGAGVAQGDTWRWDGTTWTQIPAPVARPATFDPRFRQAAAMATHPGTGVLWRFGGEDRIVTSPYSHCYSDLWRWDGAGWVQVAGEPWADPEGDGSPVTGTAALDICGPRNRLAWHPTRGTLLLYDYWYVWEYSTATASWRRHTMGGTAPSQVHSFFWDDQLGAPIALDQVRAYRIDLVNDRYEALALANPYGPSAPTTGIFVWDPGVGQAVGFSSRPWTWDSGRRHGPAHVLTVDFSRAGGPDPATCVGAAACPIQRIDLTWAAGGNSSSATGATLQLWTGGWRSGASNTAAASSPATMTYTWTPGSGLAASALFHGPARELSAMVSPSGTLSPGGTWRVASDAVAVTIRYRRP